MCVIVPTICSIDKQISATMQPMTEKKYILGADPGKKGAIVLLSSSYNPLYIEHDDIILFTTPTTKSGDINVVAIRDFLAKYSDSIVMYCMEKVHAFGAGKSSAQATFSFGHAVGTLQTILQLMGEPYKTPVLTVTPATWQKYVWKQQHIVYEKRDTIEGKNKRDTKATSLNAAHSLFPGFSFIPSKRATKEHDGCVDAALIAFYGLLCHRGAIYPDSTSYL